MNFAGVCACTCIIFLWNSSGDRDGEPLPPTNIAELQLPESHTIVLVELTVSKLQVTARGSHFAHSAL